MREWEVKVDDKGRLQLPKSFRRELAIAAGEMVRIVLTGKRLELKLLPPKEMGTIPWSGITEEGAQELHRQGIAVEVDGDKKIVKLRR